jgi:lipopolysaccharide export LptBFGC system permease protein LptF
VKSSVVLALLLLILVAIGHVVRMLFSVELSVAGDPIALWWSAPAAILFGVGAFLLWRDNRTSPPPSD